MRKPESWFHELGTKYVLAQIYFHLNQAGVIAHLAKRPASSGAAARALGLDEAKLDCLLDYAAATDDVIVRDAQGRFGFSEFGKTVLKRYGAPDGRYNMLDVRVGAYGPVWNGMGQLLARKKGVLRDGRFSEDGLYKSAGGVLPALQKALARLRPTAVVEFGADTGLIGRLKTRAPRYVLDRKRVAVRGVRTITADLFRPAQWAPKVKERERAFFFSLHFHEFLAQGREGLGESLRRFFPGGHLAVIEQPRLAPSRRDLSDSRWLYGQSNVLIHHLIGNGRIMSEMEWVDQFRREGLRPMGKFSTGFLGYILFLYQAPGSA